MFRSATLNGSGRPGVSSGDALKEMERIARETLPAGMTYAWSGISLEETKSGSQTILIFGLALLLVYLTLAAQYESLVLPFIVLLSRNVKRRPATLAAIAGGMLFARLVDVYWMIVPAMHHGAFVVHWLDLAAFLAVGGVFLGLAIRSLAERPLVPLHDPSLPLEAEHA